MNYAFFLQSNSAAEGGQHSAALHWLITLGMPGLFFVAALDSFVIPSAIPGCTDLLLLWLVSHGSNPWTFTGCAVAGSLVGGYITWNLGRKGGEAALRRYISPRMFDRIHRWAQNHPIWAVFIPAILPPPVPLSPFLLAAGALKISFPRFMSVYAAARIVRYSFVSWLAVEYGRRVLQVWSKTLDKWATPVGCVFATLMVGSILYGLWKFRRQRAKPSREPSLEPSPTSGS